MSIITPAIFVNNVTPGVIGTPVPIGPELVGPGTFICQADLRNLIAGESVTLESQDVVLPFSGTVIPYEYAESRVLTGVQTFPPVQLDPIDCQYNCRFWLNQTAGVIRTFRCSIIRVDGGLANPQAFGTASLATVGTSVNVNGAGVSITDPGIYQFRASIKNMVVGDSTAIWEQFNIGVGDTQVNASQANPAGAAPRVTIIKLDPIVVVNSAQFFIKPVAAVTALPRDYAWSLARLDS